MRVGLVGCGDISDVYLRNAPLFRDAAIVACASRRAESAAAKAARYGIAATSVDALLRDDSIDVVLNLTPPAAHHAVTMAALGAGKHVYSEKPIATTLAQGEAIRRLAEAKGLRVGCAPDTFLGAAWQTARQLVDRGAIGTPHLATAAFLSRGFENHHPNPAFFFQPGAGPVLDMGPYYLTALLALLGPVASVQAVGRRQQAARRVTNPESPRHGETIPVAVLTSVQALLTFASGAEATLIASWDVHRHHLPPIEIHGDDGSLLLPDPDWFGGELVLHRGEDAADTVATGGMTFGAANQEDESGRPVANYRGLGLAEMAQAIRAGRPHRASLEMALHALEVMNGILQAAAEHRAVAIGSRCPVLPPLPEDEAAALLRA